MAEAKTWDKVPKTNFQFYYNTPKGKMVGCGGDRVRDIATVAHQVCYLFSHDPDLTSSCLELLKFSANPDEISDSSLTEMVPFLRPCFVMYIKVEGFKERIQLEGVLNFMFAEVTIYEKGKKNPIKKSLIYNSHTIINDSTDLMMRAIKHKLGVVARRIKK